MEQFFALFAFGAICWWILLIFFFAIILFFEENEKGFIAGIHVVAYIFILQYVCKVDVFEYITNNRLLTLAYIVGYIAVGCLAWAPFKWWNYATDKNTNQYKYERKKFINNIISRSKQQVKSNNNQHAKELLEKIGIEKALLETQVPDAIKPEWIKDVKDRYPVRASRHKIRLTRWATYWPFSAFWYICNEPIAKAVNALMKIYQKISNRSFTENSDFLS